MPALLVDVPLRHGGVAMIMMVIHGWARAALDAITNRFSLLDSIDQ